MGLTHAVLGGDRNARSAFWHHVEKVEESLADRPGFIGFSKRASLTGREAWTMSVWSDEAGLRGFVRSPAPRAAIREASDALESARFHRFAVERDELPISWGRALERLEAHGRTY